MTLRRFEYHFIPDFTSVHAFYDLGLIPRFGMRESCVEEVTVAYLEWYLLSDSHAIPFIEEKHQCSRIVCNFEKMNRTSNNLPDERSLLMMGKPTLRFLSNYECIIHLAYLEGLSHELVRVEMFVEG